MRQLIPVDRLKHLTENYLLMVVLLLIPLATLPFSKLGELNMWIIATFCLNGGLFLWQILRETRRRAFSMAMMHWIFCYLFFFLAGFLQYAHGTFPWSAAPGDNAVILANLLLTVWTFLFSATCRERRSAKSWRWEKIEIPLTDRFIHVCTALSLLILAYGLVKAGPSALLSRASYYLLYDGMGQMGTLLLGTILQSATCLSLAFAILRYKQTKRRLLWVDMALCAVAVFFICSPTGLARYKAATVYIGLLLLVLPMLSRGKKFTYLFLLGMTVAWPVLNVFRLVTVQGFTWSMVTSLMNSLGEEFLTANYDAYSMLPVAIEYMGSFGITYGLQLVGAFLFFVPRALWPNKPVGTGCMMFTDLGYSFTNVSAPLPMEGLLNFGYPGVILFALIFGWLFHRLDDHYWRQRETSPQQNTLLSVLYPFMLSPVFFLCRGDMLNSFSFIIGFTAVYLALVILAKWMAREKQPLPVIAVMLRRGRKG